MKINSLFSLGHISKKTSLKDMFILLVLLAVCISMVVYSNKLSSKLIKKIKEYVDYLEKRLSPQGMEIRDD